MFNNIKRSIRPITFALLIALTISSCYSQYGEGWLSNADQSTHDGYGAWVRVILRFDEPMGKKYEGELLAVSQDSLYLIEYAQRSFDVFARQDIKEISGNTYDRGGYAIFALEALAGSITAIITTGAFSIFLIPAYIISAIIGSISASAISRISYNGDQGGWRELRTYARFPPGLPPTYNRANPKTKLATSH